MMRRALHNRNAVWSATSPYWTSYTSWYIHGAVAREENILSMIQKKKILVHISRGFALQSVLPYVMVKPLPFSGCKWGSIATLWHTNDNKEAVKSLISLRYGELSQKAWISCNSWQKMTDHGYRCMGILQGKVNGGLNDPSPKVRSYKWWSISVKLYVYSCFAYCDCSIDGVDSMRTWHWK